MPRGSEAFRSDAIDPKRTWTGLKPAEGSPALARFGTIQIWRPLGDAKCRMQIVCFFFA